MEDARRKTPDGTAGHLPRARFVIEGGRPISGTLEACGNKNAALPILAAALLTDEEVTLRNVPRIRDVQAQIELLRQLGAEAGFVDDSTVRVRAAGIGDEDPDPYLCRAIRASILLAGPLLARRGQVRMPPSGGDVIGRRRLDTHVLAVEALGADVTLGPHGGLECRVEAADGRLRGAEIFLDEASVTATENAVMAASLAKGETRILNAASEPHVQDLCRLLRLMGVRVDGIGTNALTIEGADGLGGADFTIGPDHIEVGSLVVLAAVTGGELRIPSARPQDHRATRLAFGRLGIDFEISSDGRDLLVPGGQELGVRTDLQGAIPKIEDAPWPGFPADLTSIAVVGATQSRGSVLIHEKLFESRMFFVDRLVAMGARIVLCDPHRVVVSGPSKLYGRDMVSPDIRAGMAMLIAALCAEGRSVIDNVQQIDRGYERIDERLRSLGADIERVVEPADRARQ